MTKDNEEDNKKSIYQRTDILKLIALAETLRDCLRFFRQRLNQTQYKNL